MNNISLIETIWLRIEDLRPDPENARTIRSDEEIEKMAQSLATVGQLSPIIVRRDTEGYVVTVGQTRVEAARRLGWQDIAGIVHEGNAHLLSMVENVRRTAMHPVDLWRAVKKEVDTGRSFVEASIALGVENRDLQRFMLLGKMASGILEALSLDDNLPPTHTMRVISRAPVEVQEDALAAALKQQKKGAGINWELLANRCVRKELPRSLAIFDVESSGIVFTEDLFAEPGSDQQFMTSDVRGFIAAQQKALNAEIAASNGRMMLANINDYQSIELPSGWRRDYSVSEIPKRFRKNDPRKVFVVVNPLTSFNAGRVERVLAIPPVPRGKTPDLWENDAQPKSRPEMTAATVAMISTLKGEALQAALLDLAENQESHGALYHCLKALLLFLAADNVSIRTASWPAPSMTTVIHKLIDDDGQDRQIGVGDLCDLTMEVIGTSVSFAPLANNSGDVAEWLGMISDAEKCLPRFDTAEILKGITGDRLIELARAHGINDHGKTSEIRARMVGNMPGWKPVKFAAKPPTPIEEGEDAA